MWPVTALGQDHITYLPESVKAGTPLTLTLGSRAPSAVVSSWKLSKLKLVTTLWPDVAATQGSLRRWLPMEPIAVRKGDKVGKVVRGRTL